RHPRHLHPFPTRRSSDLLRTSGGKAPGPEPLMHALKHVETVLHGAAGRPLRPIEAYDCLMWAAKAVLSGGIRRSATICLFSADEDRKSTRLNSSHVKISY